MPKKQGCLHRRDNVLSRKIRRRARRPCTTCHNIDDIDDVNDINTMPPIVPIVPETEIGDGGFHPGNIETYPGVAGLHPRSQVTHNGIYNGYPTGRAAYNTGLIGLGYYPVFDKSYGGTYGRGVLGYNNSYYPGASYRYPYIVGYNYPRDNTYDTYPSPEPCAAGIPAQYATIVSNTKPQRCSKSARSCDSTSIRYPIRYPYGRHIGAEYPYGSIHYPDDLTYPEYSYSFRDPLDLYRS